MDPSTFVEDDEEIRALLGDPAGSVKVLGTTTLAIPERPGNRRADSLLNVLSNPNVGLLFIIPGRNDTLRVNGRARIAREAPDLETMEVRGHRPVVASAKKLYG